MCAALLGLMQDLLMRDINPSPHPLRDDLGGIEELQLSIDQKGLLQPIIARPFGNGFQIIAGHRRFEACRRLKWRTIPCHVIDATDKEAYEIALVENVQQRTMDPLEEARSFKRYVEEHGFGGISELARSIGKSPAYISRRINILSLPEEVQEQLLRMRKVPYLAQELLNLNDAERSWVADLIVREHVPREEIRHIVREIKDSLNNKSYDARKLKNERLIDRSIIKSISALKLCQRRINQCTDDLEGHFAIRETLMETSYGLNLKIDQLIKARKKILAVKMVCE